MLYYKIRSLFSRKVCRYIDWIFIRDNVIIYGGKTLKVSVDELTHSRLFDEMNNEKKKQTVKDITTCFLRYGTTPRDYFLFGFDSINTSPESRSSFVTDWDKDDILIKYDGWNKYLKLSDKYDFYKVARQYYGRALYLFDVKADRESVIQFFFRTKELFIKPQNGSYGHGAFVASCYSNESAERLYEQLKKNGGAWIVEERIVQDEGMAMWNPSSVNTVRYTSILSENGFYSLTPVLRTGRKGSIVDNGGSGGILANIDLETGIIYTDGIDESGIVYSCHPDSEIPFKGTAVPHWKQLLETVKSAHESIASEHKYIGWDFALSKNGIWIVVEGNWGQFLNQYVDKQGRKEEFLRCIKT